MCKIAVLTSTRAEYGLLSPIIKKLNNEDDIDVRVVVTGAHLSSEYGNTWKEIKEDGVIIDRKIPILDSGDDAIAVSNTMAIAIRKFAVYFFESGPDALVVLGDRYETLAVCIAAMNAHIPIVHLYGGETTEGAVDEAIRHAITKLSYLHLTSTDEYRKRVIQLGEHPDRVFSVGSVGVENAIKLKKIAKEKVLKDLAIDSKKPYAMVTFHPVTLEEATEEQQVRELLEVMAGYIDIQFIVTKANADAGGKLINSIIDEYENKSCNIKSYYSLGVKKYLSALQYASFVLGNSSSGLIEAPSFRIPTINVGDRQRGRLQGDSVINCDPRKDDIKRAIDLALSIEFKKKCTGYNPYGDGNTVEKIIGIIKEKIVYQTVDLKKKFYDL